MLLSDVCLSDICLSVVYVWRNSRTERPRMTKIGTEALHNALYKFKTYLLTEVATVTRDSDTTSNVKVTRPLWLVVMAGQHGHTLMVTYPYTYMMYIVSPLAGVGGGIFWRPPAYSLLMCRMPSRLWEEWHLVCDVTWVSACWWWWFDCSAALHFIEFQFSLLPHPSSLLSLHFSGLSRWTWVSQVFFS